MNCEKNRKADECGAPGGNPGAAVPDRPVAGGTGPAGFCECYITPGGALLWQEGFGVDAPPLAAFDPARFENRDEVCPLCGRAAEDLARGDFPGCPECYRTFANGLFPDLPGEDDGQKPNDKADRWRLPAHRRAARERLTLVASLRDALHDAVSDEKYEEAAILRDRIRSLETPAVAPTGEFDEKEEKRYAVV